MRRYGLTQSGVFVSAVSRKNSGFDHTTIEKEKKMKKTLMVLMTVMLAATLGTAYANESAAARGAAIGDRDSLINTLDPTNAPAAVVAGESRIEGSGAGGTFAGISENADSLINYLDPSNAPKARIAASTATAGSRESADSLIYDLDPSNAPKARSAAKF
jgi:hypothetical protein